MTTVNFAFSRVIVSRLLTVLPTPTPFQLVVNMDWHGEYGFTVQAKRTLYHDKDMHAAHLYSVEKMFFLTPCVRFCLLYVSALLFLLLLLLLPPPPPACDLFRPRALSLGSLPTSCTAVVHSPRARLRARILGCVALYVFLYSASTMLRARILGRVALWGRSAFAPHKAKSPDSGMRGPVETQYIHFFALPARRF